VAGAGGGEPIPANAVQPVVVSQPSYIAPTPAPTYSYPTQMQPQQSGGFFSRLKSKVGGWFGQKQNCPCQYPKQSPYHQYQYQQIQPVPQITPVTTPASEPPLADAVPINQIGYAPMPTIKIHTNPSAQDSVEQPELVEKTEVEQLIKKKYIDKVGHEDDYSWVTGQLSSVRTSTGAVWVVRYATVDTEDKYGGSVVLAPAVNMKNFREGDLVSVKGEVLSEERASRYLGGPLYRVMSIDMIERAD
jgi:hypothetical protein